MPFTTTSENDNSETSESWISTDQTKVLAVGGVALTAIGYLVYRYYKYNHVMFGAKSSWFSTDDKKSKEV